MPPKPPKVGGKDESGAAAANGGISKADLAASLAELQTSLLAELKKSFFEVNGKLDGLQETVNSHGERLESLEDNAETLHERLAKMEDCCERLQADSAQLKAKLTELEGRNRRNNVRLIGLREGIEGPQPSKFFSQLFQDVFGQDTFPSPPELDRAHRSEAGYRRQASTCYYLLPPVPEQRTGGSGSPENARFEVPEQLIQDLRGLQP